MDDDDILRTEDVAVVRAAVLVTRRRVLYSTTAATILAAPCVGLTVYYLKLDNVAASTLVAAIFLLLGVPVFLHWWRHYRSILRQIDIIAQKVASGETLYGSKVAFHSYR